MKIIVASPIRETKNYIHYVAYEVTKNGMELIAASSKEGAKKIGMNYNNVDSGLPAYTFKLPIFGAAVSERLLDELKFTLNQLGKKGVFKVYRLHGHNTLPEKIKI